VTLPALAPFAQYGFMGVPVFFVISGFVIAYSAEGRTAVGFGIARFSRIYPTFVLCMTLTFLATITLGRSHFDVTATQWLANLFIAAPTFGQSYVDTSYWSLVIEIIFYAWFTLFIACRLIPSRIDAIILIWFAITFANELTIDAVILEKIFMADDSGFFAVGLLLYEYYRGRRDPQLYGILALAVGTAVFQSVHKIERLGVHTGGDFDPRIVAAICIVSIILVFLATRMRRLPLPRGLVLAAGGLTYPLYLLHMQLGYVIYMAVAPSQNIALWVAAIVSGITILAWSIWRFAEYPLHTWTKLKITEYAAAVGLKSRIARESSGAA
jgi:peptidoglycan/LPS O-acetylase OafA/YrhL